jgi:hypothetical protein
MKLRIDLFIDNLTDADIVRALKYSQEQIRFEHSMQFSIINEAGDTIGECEIVE